MDSCPYLVHHVKTVGEKLSFNERKLFLALGWGHIFTCTFNPVALYNMAVEKAFITQQSGPAVDALRRAIIAITSASPVRQTVDFENLIDFDHEEIYENANV